MELEKVKELVALMKANDLSELEIVDGQTRIMLRRGPGERISETVASAGGREAGKGVGGEAAAKEGEDAGLVKIVSPIVGTLYTAPSPSSDPFVEVGIKVQEDTVVCIIEAMKVMNEIKSEVTGTIEKVLISNGAAVEYGQLIFLVRPD